jgi:cytochrome c oxidase cbb3-type subunit III
MKFMRFKKIPFLFYALFFSACSFAQAQATGAPVKEVPSSNNMLAILMIIIALVFAFVIYGMGQVLITMIRQVLNKNKTIGKTGVVFFLLGLSLLSYNTQAQDTTAEAVMKVMPNYGGLDATAFWVLVAVLSIEVVAIGVLLFFIKRMQQELLPAKEKVNSMALKEWWARVDNKFFTKAVPIEKEADVMLDHDYDGIKELDNALPPWWKYGFIITIFFAVAYLMHFHVLGSGNNPTQEYEAELKRAAVKMEAYAAKNKDRVDENNILMDDAGGIAAGKEIFQQACWACHGKLGEGGAGPNLTDDYWIHKGSLNAIYHSLKVGYPEKGMQSWEKQYSPRQLNNITSFVKSLRGTNPPNGKAAQGDLYTEAAIADSAATVMVKESVLKK